MRIQFDLRPESVMEKERKKTSFSSMRLLVMLLLVIFFLSNGYYIVTMTLKMLDLQDMIEYKENEVSSLDSQSRQLEAEIRRLQDRERVFTSTLKIMQDDLPTLEILNALETYMELGMGLNTLRCVSGTPNTAVLTASAAVEEQIVNFTEGLSRCGVFSSVNMPSSTRDDNTGRVTFTLNLSILPIGQIKANR